MYFEFVNKTKVCAGQNALSQLEYECQQYHMKHPLILTDHVLYQLKYVDILTKHLSLDYSLYTDIPVDSSIPVSYTHLSQSFGFDLYSLYPDLFVVVYFKSLLLGHI